ncbi:MAG: YbaB/EbfC family nucleoid-associated protein [Pseudomonadota bacterium]
MLKGLGGLGDMAKLMKQAQEMQQKMAEAQERLDAIEVEGMAGAGLVRAWVTAKGAVKRVSIDPSLFVADDREVVEDLVVAALREAQEKASDAAAEEMAKVTEGMPMPPGMKLPF